MKKILSNVLLIAIVVALTLATIEFVAHIERYSPRLKNDLKRDLKAGNADAIEYYIDTYVSRGIQLFEGGEEYVRSN